MEKKDIQKTVNQFRTNNSEKGSERGEISKGRGLITDVEDRNRDATFVLEIELYGKHPALGDSQDNKEVEGRFVTRKESLVKVENNALISANSLDASKNQSLSQFEAATNEVLLFRTPQAGSELTTKESKTDRKVEDEIRTEVKADKEGLSDQHALSNYSIAIVTTYPLEMPLPICIDFEDSKLKNTKVNNLQQQKPKGQGKRAEKKERTISKEELTLLQGVPEHTFLPKLFGTVSCPQLSEHWLDLRLLMTSLEPGLNKNEEFCDQMEKAGEDIRDHIDVQIQFEEQLSTPGKTNRYKLRSQSTEEIYNKRVKQQSTRKKKKKAKRDAVMYCFSEADIHD